MTTRGIYGARPVLDRLLSRQVAEAGDAAAVTYTFTNPNQWTRTADTELMVKMPDGLTEFLPLDIPAQAGVVVSIGAASATLELISNIAARTINLEIIGNDLTFAGGVLPPATPDPLTVTFLIGGTITYVTRSEWCQVRDFTGRDQLEGNNSGFITITSRRFIVRGRSHDWTTGDTFAFEGASYSVLGVGELLGRQQYLELLCERFGN